MKATRAARKPRSVYALNFTSNGMPKMMPVRTMRCPVGLTMGPNKTCVKKTCPAGKTMNPKTGRCVAKPAPKTCTVGKTINPKTGRCVKKTCPAGKTMNPKTGRCVKKTCPTGKMMGAKGRCVKKVYALRPRA
jgi:hypothetical protein